MLGRQVTDYSRLEYSHVKSSVSGSAGLIGYRIFFRRIN